jgi:hypothetical protein
MARSPTQKVYKPSKTTYTHKKYNRTRIATKPNKHSLSILNTTSLNHTNKPNRLS